MKNVSEEFYRSKDRMSEYDRLYQEIELTLEPNGTGVMSINN